MAGGFLSIVDVFALGIDSFEKVYEIVYISISVQVGFTKGEKLLAKL
jgi:hypothetical protein